MATGKAPAQLPEETGLAPIQTDSGPELDENGFIAQETAKEHRQGPFLIGRSDIGTVRRITEADFASVGIQCRSVLGDAQGAVPGQLGQCRAAVPEGVR